MMTLIGVANKFLNLVNSDITEFSFRCRLLIAINVTIVNNFAHILRSDFHLARMPLILGFGESSENVS